MGIDVLDEAEQRDDGHIGVALVQNLVGIIGDQHAGLDAQPGVVAHIHAQNGGVAVDGADDLCAVLMQIAQNILAHFAAAVLYHFNLVHNEPPLTGVTESVLTDF